MPITRMLYEVVAGAALSGGRMLAAAGSIDNCEMPPSANVTCTHCYEGYSLNADATKCTKVESLLWLVGMCMSMFASLLVTVGLMVQKIEHQKIQKTFEETGVREPYYKKPRWCFGMVLIMSDALIDMATFGMAPQSLLAPLGAMTPAARKTKRKPPTPTLCQIK